MYTSNEAKAQRSKKSDEVKTIR